MKTADVSHTHSQNHQADQSTSSAQEQEQAFFGGERYGKPTPNPTPFFPSADSSSIQAKLRGDRPPFFQPTRVPSIQAKCGTCAAEAKQTAVPELQRMPAFESDDHPLQAKSVASVSTSNIQRMSAFEGDEAHLQRQALPQTEPLPKTPSTTPATLQPKCATCETEDKEQSEEQSEGELQVQRMPTVGNPDEGNNEDVQPIQFSLKIGQPGDIYEREADAMADQVVNTPKIEIQAQPEQTETLQHPEYNLQAKSTLPTVHSENAVSGDQITNQLNYSKGQGSPLDEPTRHHMESAFGADFSNVRIHNDSSASQLNKELGAQAFTHGSDIYFNSGKYDTDSSDGQRLLAHELTHTVQQGAVQTSLQRKQAPQSNSHQTTDTSAQSSKESGTIQFKLDKYEKPGHGENPKRRLEGEIAKEVDDEDIAEGRRSRSYERPDPAEKRRKSNAMKGPASPDINEAQIAKPRNEELAADGEDKVENPEELVESGEEQSIEPGGIPEAAEISAMQQSQARSETLMASARSVEQPEKPQEVILPEPFDPVDAAGEPLPFDMEGEQQLLEAGKKTQSLRDKGQTLIIHAQESMGQADLMEGKLELTRAAVAESEHNVNTLEEAYAQRREYVQQSEEGLGVAQDKQQREASELPQYAEEANEQKAESTSIAEESREQKAENERNRPDDPEDREKAEEQGQEIDKAVNAGTTIDDAFGQAQQQVELLRTRNEEAQQKNTETQGKIDQMHMLLDQGDAKVLELHTANNEAKGQMDARAGEPSEVRQQAQEMKQVGEKMHSDSQEKESHLQQVQQTYQTDLNTIPKFDLEKQLEDAATAGNSPDSLIQRSPDEQQATGDYSSLINVFEGTFLDPSSNLTLQQREQAAQKAQERRSREVARINSFFDKPFEEYTGWEKIKAGLAAKFANFTDWITSLSIGDIIGGIGKLILDSINPLAYLQGIGAGFMKVINGTVNAVIAVFRGDFWGFLKGTADTATGVAIIAGTITALALTISTLMTALMIFTLGGAAGVAIPVITAMSNIMAWSGPIALWSGVAALGLNVILGIKSLVDMATADSADELSAETDDLMQDVQNGVTGGAMALVGAAGKAIGPRALTNARALTLAGAIGGRGWLVKALVIDSLASLWGVASMRGVRRWFAGKLDDIRNWRRTRGTTEQPGGTRARGTSDDSHTTPSDESRRTSPDEAGRTTAQTSDFETWEARLNDETRQMLRADPELREFYMRMDPSVRRILTFCDSPCIPVNASLRDTKRIKALMDRIQVPDNHIGLREYLHARRDGLPSAIDDINGFRTRSELEQYLDQQIITAARRAGGITPRRGPDGRWEYPRDGEIIREYEIDSYSVHRRTRTNGIENFYQSHHGIQDAWARTRLRASSYTKDGAPGILLRSRNLRAGSRGTPHGIVNTRQRGRSSERANSTYAQQREYARADLRDVQVPERYINDFLAEADRYFGQIYDELSQTMSSEELRGIFGDWQPS